jgi:CGNR zinc finger
VRVLDVDDAVERRVNEERDTSPFDGDVAFLRTVGQDEPDAVSFGHDPDARARVEPSRRAVGLREEIRRPPGHVDHRSSVRTGSRGPYRSGPPRESATIRDVRFRLPVKGNLEASGTTMNAVDERLPQPVRGEREDSTLAPGELELVRSCSMQTCGNRNKVRAFRHRHASTA